MSLQVEAMSDTTSNPRGIIADGWTATDEWATERHSVRITAGLGSSQYAYKTHDVATALDLIAKQHNLYEITTDDEENPKKPEHSHIGLLRLYGDIDLYVSTKKQAADYDNKIERCLRSVFSACDFALMCATGDDHGKKAEQDKKWKVSWRFVLPSSCSTKTGAKRYALEVIEPQLKSALKTEGINLDAVLDASVYAPAKKMRMLGSSKDGENRPLLLVKGEAKDTLITFIPEGCKVLVPPALAEVEKPKKAATKSGAKAAAPKTGAELPARQFAFMTELADLVPLAILDDYSNCCGFIWAYWNEERSHRMLELIATTCGKSAKYASADVAGLSGLEWVKSKLNAKEVGGKRVGSVVYWVRKANPAAVSALFKKFPRGYIDELFGKSLKPQKVVEYDSRYVLPFPVEDYDTIALESALGTGKTFQIMGSRKHNIQGLLARRKVQPVSLTIGKDGKFATAGEVLDFPRVLFVSGRKSFTRFALGELEAQNIKFENYEDLHGQQLASKDRLFIQVESLWKLADGFQTYDLVIIDESETITHQLNSVQTNKENMIDNHIIFERVVSSARKVIVADAFLSDRSFSFIRELRNPAHSVYIKNTHQPYKRTAIELQTTEEDERIPNTGLFISRIMAAIKAKKRVVIVWTSKRKGLAFEKDYLLPLKEAGLRWKYYHGDSTKADRADLAYVSKAWASLDVLMHTTSISVGVSYNPCEAVAQFDECFLWACAASATPRDIAQALLRCRVLKADRLTYVCDLRTILPSVRGFDALREYVNEKKKRIQADHPIVQWKTAPKWAEDNYIYNENEVRVSRAEYKAVLRYYLEWCGYTINSEGSAAMDYKLKNIGGAAYDEIAEIDGEEAETIRHKMQRDEAEPMERLAYKKFKFLSALKPESHEGAEAVWDEYMKDIKGEHYFWNMVQEKHTKTADTAAKECEKRYLTMAARHLEQRITLDKLLMIVGMSHTQEQKTIKGEDFAKMTAAAAGLEREVRQVFGIRKSERKNDKAFCVKTFHDMIQSVWNAWSGADINTTNERRITIDGKRVRVYDYEFQPRQVWAYITDRSVDE